MPGFTHSVNDETVLPRQEIGGTGVAREIAIVLQALDMTVPDGSGTYLAVPVSTGRRYYEALADAGEFAFDGLIRAIGKAKYLEKVLGPNVDESERIAAELRCRGVLYVINPAPLRISGWCEPDYIKLCFSIIMNKAKEVYFVHPEWAFSTGAAEEFLFCTRRGIPCQCSSGETLTLDKAHAALTKASAYVDELGLDKGSFGEKLRELELLMARPLRGVERP